MTDTTPVSTPVNARLIDIDPIELDPFVEVAPELSQAAFYLRLDDAAVLADRLRELATGRCCEADQTIPIGVSGQLTVRLVDNDPPLIELLAYPDAPSVSFNVGFDQATQLADRLYELVGEHAQQ
jgi:hypothetical protein